MNAHILYFINELDRDLYKACCPPHPDYELIKSIVNKGANVNATNVYGIVLMNLLIYHQIQRRTDLEVFDHLESLGADFNLGDEDGITPIVMAMEVLNPALVDTLLVNGADPNLVNNSSESLLDFLYIDLNEKESELAQLKNDEYVEIAMARDYIRRYKSIIEIMEYWGAKSFYNFGGICPTC